MKTVQEMIDVMTHYANGGKVEYLDRNRTVVLWEKCDPIWNWEYFDYRIAKTEPKKIKLLAWFDGGNLRWCSDDCAIAANWKRVPSKDMEIEVE